ncbi:MAG TPA: SpoIID/LytB domain-containing protein [Bacillota bacterium]
MKPFHSFTLKYIFPGLFLAALLIIPGSVTGAVAPADPGSNAATSLYYQGDYQASLDEWQKLIDSRPEKARRNLVQLLREAERYDEALNQLDELLKTAPQDPDYRQTRLELSFLAGHSEQVVADCKLDQASAAELFWLGMALLDLGKPDEAGQIFKKSLAKEGYNPAALYQLGGMSLARRDFGSARDYFRAALAQDSNWTPSYFPLAKAYIGLANFTAANNLLTNAGMVFPEDPEIAATLQQLLADHPELAAEPPQETKARREVASPKQVNPILEGRESIPTIRIGLAEGISQLFLKTSPEYTLTTMDLKTIAAGSENTVLQFKANPEGITVLNEAGTVLYQTAQPLILTYENPSATTILFDMAYGQGSFWAGRADRTYRGRIELIPMSQSATAPTITVVNQLNVEEYLYAVVPSEISSSWPRAAQEAQAIAARTYAFANLGGFAGRGFDLMATVASQVYNGVGAETPAARAAVDATRGQILTYNGKPIAAFFHGNSGGFTGSSADLWNLDLSYLRPQADLLLPATVAGGRMDPADLWNWLLSRPLTYSSQPKYSAASSYRWSFWISRVQLERRLNQGDKLGQIRSLTISGRGDNGMVKQVLITGTGGSYRLKGDKIRSAMGGLRSNLFVVEAKLGKDGLPEYFIFSGAGWGHGIGMDQSGAAGMAAAGYSSTDILKHYYPGTQLVKKY